MLDAIKFVRGAISKKDFVPALTHYAIASGRIRGFNGDIALCSPIPLDLEIYPKAGPFQKAVEACEGVVQLSKEENGHLLVTSGGFCAYVECLPDGFPNIFPEGTLTPIPSGLVGILTLMEPFIAEDASRRWATNVLLRGSSAYATNNILLVESWLGFDFPVEVCISKQAVQELIRIKEDPVAIQVGEKSMTFHYDGGRWLRAQNSPIGWPDVSAILERPCSPEAFPVGFFEAVGKLKPFANSFGQIYFKDGRISTSSSEKEGASVRVPELHGEGSFSVHQLALLESVASRIDFTQYPDPCLFFGERTRGALVGIRI